MSVVYLESPLSSHSFSRSCCCFFPLFCLQSTNLLSHHIKSEIVILRNDLSSLLLCLCVVSFYDLTCYNYIFVIRMNCCTRIPIVLFKIKTNLKQNRIKKNENKKHDAWWFVGSMWMGKSSLCWKYHNKINHVITFYMHENTEHQNLFN